VERMIRAKKPWAVTAAAVLLLGTSILTLGYNMQFRAVASSTVKEEMKKGDGVKQKADKFDKEVKRVEDKIEEDKKAVKSIVFGQDERLNWMLFNQFINRALPKPNASNLSEEARKLFWTDQPRAKMAYQKFVQQQMGTGRGGESKADEEEWRDYLIQANV